MNQDCQIDPAWPADVKIYLLDYLRARAEAEVFAALWSPGVRPPGPADAQGGLVPKDDWRTHHGLVPEDDWHTHHGWLGGSNPLRHDPVVDQAQRAAASKMVAAWERFTAAARAHGLHGFPSSIDPWRTVSRCYLANLR